MDYELIAVTTPEDWMAYHAIRRQELFEAKGRHGIYDPNRADERQPGMHHFMFRREGKPIGTTRLDIRADGTCVFRLVAITAAEQGRGHGRVMGAMVEAQAKAFGARIVLVNAAPSALGYYEALGWQRYVWDREELVSIASDCIQMRKLL